MNILINLLEKKKELEDKMNANSEKRCDIINSLTKENTKQMLRKYYNLQKEYDSFKLELNNIKKKIEEERQKNGNR